MTGLEALESRVVRERGVWLSQTRSVRSGDKILVINNWYQMITLGAEIKGVLVSRQARGYLVILWVVTYHGPGDPDCI